jgi:hypothetical protein
LTSPVTESPKLEISDDLGHISLSVSLTQSHPDGYFLQSFTSLHVTRILLKFGPLLSLTWSMTRIIVTSPLTGLHPCVLALHWEPYYKLSSSNLSPRYSSLVWGAQGEWFEDPVGHKWCLCL